MYRKKRFMKRNVVGGLILFIFALMVAGAMVWYDPTLPSWFYMATDAPVNSWLSYLVATFGGCWFMLFGSAALLWALLLFYSSYCLMAGSLSAEWDRLFGMVGVILVSSMIGAYTNVVIMYHGFRPGGLIGSSLLSLLTMVIDAPLIPIVLNGALLSVSILMTRLSLLSFLPYIERAIFFLFDKKRFLQPLGSSIKKGCQIIRYSIRALYRYGKELFDGSIIESSSIIEHDFEEIVHEELHDEQVWQQLLGDRYQHTNIPAAPLAEHEAVVSVGEHEVDRHHDGAYKEATPSTYALPPVSLLEKKSSMGTNDDTQKELERLAQVLEEKLGRFGITGTVFSIKQGPVITLFEYQPHIDSKVSKIIALEDDLALALQAKSIRIIAPIPGRSVVGFEVANKERQSVLFSAIMHEGALTAFDGHLPFVLGADTIGNPVIADLATMPHLLVAGATGSGKSVALNVLLVSLLYRCSPDELQLILIDPKRLEFAPYADIAHLIFPIITNPKDATPALQWVIQEMEERYEKMATANVRNVYDYNRHIADDPEKKPLPLLVVIIDELADLMMVAGKTIEEKIARIAQMARAAGIHLVVATQRPSVDVITGVIKANFPTRIACKVATKVDSRTILDGVGADKLLGKGDMLYLDATSSLFRIHGAYIADKEVHAITDYIRKRQHVAYLDLYAVASPDQQEACDGDEELYKDVCAFLQSVDEVSISLLQRRFRIGYNRSARIIDMLEAEGLIMPHQGGKTRKVIH